MIAERVEKVRKKMKDRNIDAFIVMTADPHQSEYIPDFYKTREYISGFTGSSGFAIITAKRAALFTDGRYEIQAKRELEESPYELFITNDNKNSMLGFLNENVKEFGRVGFDGSCMSLSYYRYLSRSLQSKALVPNCDFIGEIWEDRPSLSKNRAYFLDEKYSGESAISKISRLREKMEEKGSNFYYVGALDEIAYLLNMRGSDIDYNPVVLSHLLVGKDRAWLCIDPDKLDENMLVAFEEMGVTIQSYDYIYRLMADLGKGDYLYLDPDSTSFSVFDKVSNSVGIELDFSLIGQMKMIKNHTEIKNTKEAFKKDALSLVKFFNWVETGAQTGNLTEKQASDKLLEFRKENEGFKDLSFETISAYGENAALPHYAPGNKSKTIENKGLYLVDSGGQYLEGTTDITRTLALGPLTDYERFCYTNVLKSHIALATCVFKKGTRGSSLDAIAREPLWRRGLDFNHGTGHGLGYFLNVHEGPHRISRSDGGVEFQPGMYTSDEPGLYIEGEFGIRIENILLVKEEKDTDFGSFYSFDMLSYVPIDTRPLDLNLMTDFEINWLNDYNKKCFNLLAPSLVGDELDYLESQTKKIER